MEKDKALWGLLRRRQVLVPTWRAWLALVVAGLTLGVIGARRISPFLAVNDPIPGGVLVVEGWAQDFAMEAAVAEFNRNHYEKLYVTGGPLDEGGPLSEYKTFAELGSAVLLKMGLNTNAVQPVPAPRVRQDRTYSSAVAMERWCREHGVPLTKVNLMTVGAHARRSRLLFEKALGKDVTVGVIAVPEWDFDSAHWWRSSAGVRITISETLAYGYARLLFHPSRM